MTPTVFSVILVLGITGLVAGSPSTDDCVDGDGSSYRGPASTTREGVKCHKWSKPLLSGPHDYWTQDDRDNRGIGDHNYCRNPDDSGGPWCFKSGASDNSDWDYCDIRTCQTGRPVCNTNPDLDCVVGDGRTYRGSNSTSWRGMTCKNWALVRPDQKDKGWDHNHCRNYWVPYKSHPWCMLEGLEKIWDYCDIPTCHTYDCVDGDGSSYRGPASTTKKGVKCQKWSKHKPRTSYWTQDNRDNRGIGDHNYCRNPDDSEGPWCFTSDVTEDSKKDYSYWDYCDVPTC